MRIGTVEVRGPSMVPTLRSGDRLLVLRTRRIRPGDVVVARFRQGYEGLVVKRAVTEQDRGWLLASDNPFGGSAGGVGDVEAKVLLRYWPLPRRRA